MSVVTCSSPLTRVVTASFTHASEELLKHWCSMIREGDVTNVKQLLLGFNARPKSPPKADDDAEICEIFGTNWPDWLRMANALYTMEPHTRRVLDTVYLDSIHWEGWRYYETGPDFPFLTKCGPEFWQVAADEGRVSAVMTAFGRRASPSFGV